MSNVIRLTVNGKETDVLFKNAKGRHQKSWFNLIKKVSKEPEQHAITMLEFFDSMVLELQDAIKTQEQLDDLDIIEKQKLYNYIREQFQLFNKQEDFIAPSKKQ